MSDVILKCAAVLCFIMAGIPLSASETRSLPESPDSMYRKATMVYMNEKISGDVVFADSRTEEEKNTISETGSAPMEVILFSAGHGLPAETSWAIIRELSLHSASGIVIAPASDTPADGDAGKEILFMELAAACLNEAGISIQGLESGRSGCTEIFFDGKKYMPSETSRTCTVAAGGWSHGALLSRRIASRWQKSVTSLFQMAPAGYTDWGNRSCCGPLWLAAAFSKEGICTACTFSEPAAVFNVSLGMTESICLDSCRSCSPVRPWINVQDCALQADDSDFPVPDLKYLAVILGADDSLFSGEKLAGTKDKWKASAEEQEKFFSTYYPSAAAAGTECTLMIEEGRHSGPLSRPEKWTESALKAIRQYRD